MTLGGELSPAHLPQCALGPIVTGHGVPLDIFPHPSKLYPSEGEWAGVRPGVGSPGSVVWTVTYGHMDIWTYGHISNRDHKRSYALFFLHTKCT